MRRKGALRVLFGVSGDLDLCFGEDAYDWGCNFVVDDGFVVFGDSSPTMSAPHSYVEVIV